MTSPTPPPQVPPIVGELHATREAMIDVVGALDKLASQDYVRELHVETKKRARRQFWIVTALSLVIIGLLGGVVFLGVKVYNISNNVNGLAINAVHTSKVNQRLNHRTQRAINILLECTTPSTKHDPHECSDQGMANQAAAVGQLLSGIFAANTCADQPGTLTYPELRSCVKNLLPDPDPTNNSQ